MNSWGIRYSGSCPPPRLAPKWGKLLGSTPTPLVSCWVSLLIRDSMSSLVLRYLRVAICNHLINGFKYGGHRGSTTGFFAYSWLGKFRFHDPSTGSAWWAPSYQRFQNAAGYKGMGVVVGVQCKWSWSLQPVRCSKKKKRNRSCGQDTPVL